MNVHYDRARALLHAGRLETPQSALEALMAEGGSDGDEARWLCREACIQAMTHPARNAAVQALIKVASFLEEGKPL